MVSAAEKKRAFFFFGGRPEKTFFLLSLLGGFMGIHLAMNHFRHKTLHFSFKFIVVISAFLWGVVFPWLYFSLIFQYVKA